MVRLRLIIDSTFACKYSYCNWIVFTPTYNPRCSIIGSLNEGKNKKIAITVSIKLYWQFTNLIKNFANDTSRIFSDVFILKFVTVVCVGMVCYFVHHCWFITVFTVFRLLTDFVCLYNYEFLFSLCKISRSSVILLLPLFVM